MSLLASAFVAAGLAGRAIAGTVQATDMGPAAFMWPADRVWSAALDNTAPCGSAASAGNRTKFPLTGGKVALVDQTEGFDLQLAISYSNDPKSNDDFQTILIQKTSLAELDPGHTCVSVADAPSSVQSGNNATLQIIYTSTFDSPNNETFYACADITYVLASAFTTEIPCFNATEKPDHTSSASGTSASAASTASSGTSSNSGASSPSAGVIAGAVVGSVVGVALIVAAGFFVYRSRERKRRQAMMDQSRTRAVKWDEQHASTRASGSQNSVPLRDL